MAVRYAQRPTRHTHHHQRMPVGGFGNLTAKMAVGLRRPPQVNSMIHDHRPCPQKTAVPFTARGGVDLRDLRRRPVEVLFLLVL